MRTLFVGALAATLVGCSCFVSPQAGIEACTGAGGGFACLDRTAVGQAIEPEPGTFDADSAAPRTRSRIAARTEKPSSARTRDKTRLAMKTAKSTAAATKVEPAASSSTRRDLRCGPGQGEDDASQRNWKRRGLPSSAK